MGVFQLAVAVAIVAAATTTWTGWPRRHRPRFVDHDPASRQIGAIHLVDCSPGVVVIHLNEPEAAGAARVSIHEHLGGLHFTKPAKGGRQIL
jgi:hypothetical protein